MTIAERLMEHAEKNYTRDGWDFLVECWTIEEIEEELANEGIDTFYKAKKYFGEIYGLVDEKRQEIKSIR